MKSLLRLVLMGLVLVVVALVSALTAMRFAIHGREVTVPDLQGKTPAEARRLADESGFQFVVERQYYSPNVQEGHILSQLPAPGTLVRRGWELRVAESLGPQRVAIPNVMGQSQRAAEINIRRRGLDVGEIALLQMPGMDTDQVIAQNPTPNASGIAAPKISLLLTGAPDTPSYTMPSFIGQPLSSASVALQDAGMRLGTVKWTNQPPQTMSANGSLTSVLPPTAPPPSSVVVSQTPVAGQKIQAGTTVSFEVR